MDVVDNWMLVTECVTIISKLSPTSVTNIDVALYRIRYDLSGRMIWYDIGGQIYHISEIGYKMNLIKVPVSDFL